MRKILTIKSFQFLIIWGVIITPLSILTISAAETPLYLAKVKEMVKSNALTSASLQYEDIVVDELVMVDGSDPEPANRTSSPSNCGWGTPQTKSSGSDMNVKLEDGDVWRAKFIIDNSELVIRLSYNSQTDVLSFSKTLGSGMTYSIAADYSSISFFHNGVSFLTLDNIRTCGSKACAKVRFLKNRTSMSLYECTSAAYSVTTNNSIKPFVSESKSGVVDEADDVKLGTLKRNIIVPTHRVAPNPVSNQANISYNLSSDAKVRVAIYNAIGQQIEVLVNQNQPQGEYVVEWQASNILQAGMYFYEIMANDQRMIGKIIKQD